MAGALVLPSGLGGRIAQAQAALPLLRQDLQLLPGPASGDGTPSWTIHDPARHRFVRIGWAEFEFLSRWDLGDAAAIARSVSAQTTIRATARDVEMLAGFLLHAGMTVPSGPLGIAQLVAEAGAGRLSAAGWLLKNYLFLRVRLLNPDRLLRAMVPATNFVFTRGFLIAMAVLALIALYHVGRQWDGFTHSFQELFSLEGALLVGVALSCAKVIHEIGHGLAARHFGCKVPAMGVALLVLWPVLWTDTTDAWRLTDRRQRLIVDASGMAAELVLAVFAGLAWAILADGPLRTAAFLLCSSTWLITLAINLNPLMRFDGYFLLSDGLEIPNLQDRAFALARWRLRETLFDLRVAPPEIVPAHTARLMLIYAYCTWVYRFFLFLGIAVLVYHLAFKLLGLFLMAVEIWWFIARPIIREMSAWLASLRPRKTNARTWFSVGLAGLVLLILALPWRTEISAPAVLRANRQTAIYTATAGELQRTSANGRQVAAGEVLFQLGSEPLLWRQRQTQATVDGLRADLIGLAFDPNRAANLAEAKKSLEQALAELRSNQAEQDAQTITAPFAGMLTDVPWTLQIGATLPRREMLGVLIDPADPVVEAYVDEGDVTRFALGAAARFYPEDGGDVLDLAVIATSPGSARVLDAQDLASINGGGVAVRKDNTGRLVPEHAVYRVLLRLRTPVPVLRRQRGAITIDGERVSPLRRIYDRAVAVAVRESGL
jgi:putative peptide zinc metalloprotease protein